MFRSSCVFLCLALFIGNPLLGEEKPVHLFILSGQSNMAGMNPKAGFEQEAVKLFPEMDVVYIKVAYGGKPIRLWVKEWDQFAEEHGIEVGKARKNDPFPDDQYYQQILAEYQKVAEQHPKIAAVTFCWMQGERDAREKFSELYDDSLQQLISNLRKDLKQPKMMFVVGRLSDHGKETDEHWQNIRQIQVDIPKGDPLGAWVDCDDLNNKSKEGVTWNDLHYTKEGYELLGQRYARQARLLWEGKEPAQNGRP